ncbi:MAG: bi-domain-containing oxidoreductase [Desulfarculaceae bacterium]|nr:bi-domain-containing oxidoreductase [Desulfarculaceae bacterium]MCF8118291.1 bi-domain-containing oxidoreductase [Desulfarculaceae bacterium]
MKIKTILSLISPGTERMLLEFSKGSLLAKAKAQPDKVKQVLDKIKSEGLLPTLEKVFQRLDEPLPLGYCNVGRVLEVGAGVTRFTVGDMVVSNGPHAEIVCVPKNLCAKVPPGVSPEQAAFTVLGSIGLQGIRLAQPTLGEKFVVFGSGLIGLLTIQLLRASGCLVLAVDLDPGKLELAARFGAETCLAGQSSPAAAAEAWTLGAGVDGVIITASAKKDDIVHQAAEMCRRRGRIVLVGVTDLNLRRSDFYEKELSFQVSCSYGPGRYDSDYEVKGRDYPMGLVRWTEQRNFTAVLDMMAQGRLEIAPLICHRISFDQAVQAYDGLSGDAQALGVLLEYTQEPSAARTVPTTHAGAAPSAGECVAALIGAGNFAKMVLAPALAKSGARLQYLCAQSNGAAASHLASKYGFASATTSVDELWEDPQLNTVFIATRHDSHAALVGQALYAGKQVFVEKPLCLSPEELASVLETYGRCDPAPRLMVGFNRRFSPYAVKARELLAGRDEPLAMTCTVNAGIISPDVWVHDPAVGGGRIVGEACHFIDLMVFLSGSLVSSVAAVQMKDGVAVGEDKAAIILAFEDGSLGSINYFANGAADYPKEQLEVFSQGRVLHLDNYRAMTGHGFLGFKKFSTRGMDKGHAAEVAAFVKAVAQGGEPLIRLDETVNVTLASFAAVAAAGEGRAIQLGNFLPTAR